MDEDARNFIFLGLRYLSLILIALPNLFIFYWVFTPVTVYLVYFLLSLFFEVSLSGTIISFTSCLSIDLIEACVAGSAYYLLTLFNISTPNIPPAKRILFLFSSYFVFLILNVLRIFILSILLFKGSNLFDFSHRLSWYLVSTLFVVGIWFLGVKLFSITEIPFYSDVKYLLIKSNLVSEK
jgi:exosortase/archaeosortase family protein